MKLSEIALALGCRMEARSDPEITGVAGIEEAGPGELTFVSNRKYIRHIKDTRASAILLDFELPAGAIPCLRTPNPYLAFARALELFHAPLAPPQGIHPSAVLAADARIEPGASIGPHVVVGAGCSIGARATLFPHVVIYPDVSIGDDVILHAGVVIREKCRIGHRVTIQNGSIIGSDGFGFAPVGDGTYHKIRQTGYVRIEDDVEIGANTTVDRAAVGATFIRRGAKLDNLVQIGHGSQVGEDSVLAAQVGLAGSTKLGRRVMAGGQVGFAGHQEIGDGVILMAQAGIHGEVESGAMLAGSPAFDTRVWRRSVTAFPKLPELQRQVRTLEKELQQLKQQIQDKDGK
jgi:UDP-3-O-[3-hydroxymyristoyl] glucosamine N-acyltransferase